MAEVVPLMPQFPAVVVPPPSGRPESAWWSQVVSHAAALDAFYRRFQEVRRLSQTLDFIREDSIRALARLSGPSYARLALGIGTDAGNDVDLTMGAEIGWWLEMGRSSLALAAVLGLHEPTPNSPEHPDAAVACEIHKKVRMALYLMVPDGTSAALTKGLTMNEPFIQMVVLRHLELEGGAWVM